MEKTLILKFDTLNPTTLSKLFPGEIFMRKDEGLSGNIYVKTERKDGLPHNLTRPGIVMFPGKNDVVYRRVF